MTEILSGNLKDIETIYFNLRKLSSNAEIFNKLESRNQQTMKAVILLKDSITNRHWVMIVSVNYETKGVISDTTSSKLYYGKNHL